MSVQHRTREPEQTDRLRYGLRAARHCAASSRRWWRLPDRQRETHSRMEPDPMQQIGDSRCDRSSRPAVRRATTPTNWTTAVSMHSPCRSRPTAQRCSDRPPPPAPTATRVRRWATRRGRRESACHFPAGHLQFSDRWRPTKLIRQIPCREVSTAPRQSSCCEARQATQDYHQSVNDIRSSGGHHQALDRPTPTVWQKHPALCVQ